MIRCRVLEQEVNNKANKLEAYVVLMLTIFIDKAIRIHRIREQTSLKYVYSIAYF